MKAVLWAAIAMLAVGAANAAGALPDQFEVARELYARADYGEALAVLNRLPEVGTPAETFSIMQYRALCLLALGQTPEAEHAVEAMVAAVPSYRAAEADISPRLQSAVSQIRRRMLPDIVMHGYVAARAAYERQDYESATGTFRDVLDLLDDPDIATAAAQQPLSDLRLLASGFVQLRAAVGPAVATSTTPLLSEAFVAPTGRLQPTGVYTSNSPHIVPPVTISQTLPVYRGRPLHPMKGVIEVTIDETGAVSETNMRLPIDYVYDALALESARTWRYVAASVDGVPVRYLKLVYINILPTR
jgi:tetratricopeptide (TPR) repeat protein